MTQQNLCPLTNIRYSNKCRLRDCPFNSKKAKTGCFNSVIEITPSIIAHHKKLNVREVKAQLSSIETRVYQSQRLFKYAQTCKPQEPNAASIKKWEKEKRRLPYSSALFQFIDLERFTSMLDEENYTNFLRVYNLNRNQCGKTAKKFIKGFNQGD